MPLEQTEHLKKVYDRGINAGWKDEDFIGLVRLLVHSERNMTGNESR